MSQNVLIGVAAFSMALWATMSLDRKEGAEKPSFMEIWYRFPKFVLGFIVASLVVSFIAEPIWGEKVAKQTGDCLLDFPDRQCGLDIVHHLDPVVRYVFHTTHHCRLIETNLGEGVFSKVTPSPPFHHHF